MNPRNEAAWEVHRFLTAHDIPYVIIGGFAVQKWSDPRFTKDVDLTVPVSLSEGSRPLVRLLSENFQSREADPFAFARKTRMVLLTASNGVGLDISLAVPGYEDNLFDRVFLYELERGKSVNLCSAEDLIILKAVAGRPQDIIDIQGVVYRQGEKLDLTYIRFWLDQFSQLLENTEVLDRFESAWRKFLEN